MCRKKIPEYVSYNKDFTEWFQLSKNLNLNLTSIKF